MLGRLKKRIGSTRPTHGPKQEVQRSISQPTVRAPRSSPPSSFFLERAVDYNTKVVELAAFDACVEACDALAASSSYAQSSVKLDRQTGLRDCSVLVSPDGDLLLVPQDTQEISMGLKLPKDAQSSSPPSSPVISPSHSMEFGGQNVGDYESAVIMGSDLRTDKSMNGFSAMGWSAPATSLALRQTEHSLREMVNFVEEVILTRKEGAARVDRACDQLRKASAALGFDGKIPSLPVPKALRQPSNNGGWKRNSAGTTEFDGGLDSDVSRAASPTQLYGNNGFSNVDPSPHRVGPIVFAKGTLHAATVAMEQYHSLMAENDANRWRMASKTDHHQMGVLPALHDAAEHTAERAYNREKALKEMQERADATENRLQQCKAEAKRRWDAVHKAEEAVTKIVEERMIERSRDRERRRLEQLREEEEKQKAENTDFGATPGEIWDIVSAVAESMDDGSFAPTGLPQVPFSGLRDKSLDQNDSVGETNSENSDPEVVTSTRAPSPPLAPFPLASRAEIEHECHLPALRAAAMAADEAVEDVAGSLLNILSTLDTTRRSARIAAETCLLSACHAQAACIKSLVALERASLEERLKHINDLERVADSINVRADLDAYITNDKTIRGGSAWLGDDDDGGVASALAVLSSHVDGNMGLGSPSKIVTDGWCETEDEEISLERLEDSIDDLFASNDLLLAEAKDDSETKRAREEFESTISFLCKVASEMSSAARSRRSTICYALNAKRSSNAEMPSRIQFDGICRLFSAILSGCDNEAGGVSNAKMCMMLSQTFYMLEEEDKENGTTVNPMGSPVRSSRSKRIFVKSCLMDHRLWTDEEFWDQALYQCVSESLTHSGVMSNFDTKFSSANRSEWTEAKKLKWHDLTQNERSEAASQVHAVVFAQLGALAHSMVEFGCGLERSCAFVRRMAIRNQLPLSQRRMLLQHLMGSEEQK